MKFLLLIIYFLTLVTEMSAMSLFSGDFKTKGRYITASKICKRYLLETTSREKYCTYKFYRPHNGWKEDLNKVKYIKSSITNRGDKEVNILFWAVGERGWNSVATSAKLQPKETKTLQCNLRACFKDGTYKINPKRISHIEFIFVDAPKGSKIEILDINTVGVDDVFQLTSNRLEVPMIENCKPKQGKRVIYPFAKNSNLYGVLYLPRDWTADKSLPLIVEFPGNIYYTDNCYSTGRPEQCVIGYGMTKGDGALWLSLPFVDYSKDEIVESGWGNPDDTADFTVKMVEKMRKEFRVDTSRVVLTGFSRGAIACGFIGLRNSKIASLWKGMHVCQHFDGDGWRGANKKDAILRLKNGIHIPQFHTDNSSTVLYNMLNDANIKTTYTTSGLGAHACDMFLDDRQSTLELRTWLKNLFN